MTCIDTGFFFFNNTATPEIYTLSLHDALPICCPVPPDEDAQEAARKEQDRQDPERDDRHGTPRLPPPDQVTDHTEEDRKSTRLNSSHANISYAVFCLKKN